MIARPLNQRGLIHCILGMARECVCVCWGGIMEERDGECWPPPPLFFGGGGDFIIVNVIPSFDCQVKGGGIE